MESSAHEKIRSQLRAMKAAPPGDIAAARAALDNLLGTYPLPEGTRVEPALANGVPAQWVSAGEMDADRAFLYLHGGAYTRGSFVTARGLAARISGASGARALVIEYRLAPEHPFPAALDDAVAAYRWLVEQGLQPGRLAICGDSAGGGLTMGTLLTLRHAGDPLPAGAALISPWVDLTGEAESVRTLAEADPWLNAERLSLVAGLYLGNTDPHDPVPSPVFADLRDLPPILIQVGTDEILLDDSTTLARRAEVAGVDATLEVWNGMWHVFQAFASEIPEGQQAIDNIGAFLRRVAGRQTATR